MDMRFLMKQAQAMQTKLAEAQKNLRAEGTAVNVLFLDATDDVLIRRYEGTRRRHPFPAASVA